MGVDDGGPAGTLVKSCEQVFFISCSPARRRHPGATSGIPGRGPSGGAPESSRAEMRRKEAAYAVLNA